MYSEPNFRGQETLIALRQFDNQACVDLPRGTGSRSVGINGPRCCILYRSPCPKRPVGDWPQIPLFLNQRVFADIEDLEPLGFAGVVRSVVCPHTDVCKGIEVDHEYYGQDLHNIRGYWIDSLNLPRA